MRAAARLLLDDGPAAVTHRAVAATAGVPLAATTYYFSGRDDLLAAAGAVVADGWAEHAERVARSARASSAGHPAAGRAEAAGAGSGGADGGRAAALLADAVLPPGGAPAVLGTYEHLVGAGRHPALVAAYAAGRDRLDAAVAGLVAALGLTVPAPLVVAVVDGAAVSALSEGRDPVGHARELVGMLLRRR